LGDFGAAVCASEFVGDAFAFAEEIFLLGFIEAIKRESGGFDVENKFGHCDAETFVAGGVRGSQPFCLIKRIAQDIFWTYFNE
jgi:hypothetical protein